MKGALDIARELLGRGVTHEIVRLPRPVVGADDLPDALRLPASRCLAVRVYDVDGTLVAALVPAGTLPDPLALLRATGGGELALARPERVNAATDYAAGLVAPLLLPTGLTVLADVGATGDGVVYTPTGDTGTALGIGLEDLLRHSGARRHPLRPAPVAAALPEAYPRDVVTAPAAGWR